MSRPPGDKGLSNEAIYRQTWATFVDSAVAQHQSSDAKGVGERIELRDFMRLEEVLSKIENAAASERGGQADGMQLLDAAPENRAPTCARARQHRDDTRTTARDRKPLGKLPGLPPLFQNPNASFLESLYPTSVQAGDQDGAPFYISRAGTRDAGGKVDPGRTLEPSARCAVVAEANTEPGSILPQDTQDKGSPCSGTPLPAAGARAPISFLERGLADDADREGDSVRGLAFGRCDVSGSESSRVAVSEEKPNSRLAVGSEIPPSLVPGPSLNLEASPLKLGMPTGHGLSAERSLVVNAVGEPEDEPALDNDCSVLTAWGERTILAQSQQGRDEEDSSAGELHDDRSALMDEISLSALLDATRIEADEDGGSDECLTSVLSPQSALGVTVLEGSQCASHGDCSGTDLVVAGGDGTFLGIDEQSTVSSGSRSNISTNSTAERTSLEAAGHLPSRELDRRVSAGSGPPPGDNGCSTTDDSGDRHPGDHGMNPLVSLGPNPQVQNEEVRGETSVDCGDFGAGAGSPREPIPEREGDSCAYGADSPEVLRHASVSRGSVGTGEGPVRDRGSWGVDAEERPCRNDPDNDVGCAMALRENASAVDHTCESTFSPAIAGFGVDIGDAMSPLALLEPLDADGVDDYDNQGWESPRSGGLSPVRSVASESTIEPVQESPPRREDSRLVDGKAWWSSRRRNASTFRGGLEGAELEDSMASSPRRRVSLPQATAPERRLEFDTQVRVEASDGRVSIGRYGSPLAAAVVSEKHGAMPREPSRACSGGRRDYNEQLSIGSFSESDEGGSRFVNESEQGQGKEEEHADISLVEGTPRRRRVDSRENLAGFYAPLPVVNKAKASDDASLSALQQNTLQWMAWRENGCAGEGEGDEEGGAAVAAAATPINTLRGGILGHLSSEEASACVLSLLRDQSLSPPGGKADRVGQLHAGTGLPRGSTLLIASTKDTARDWTERLESGAGLSVLSYTMPLKDRRRLSAKQVAAFRVVVTTYDILKAKEVPRAIEAPETSPTGRKSGSARWHTRNTREGQKRAAPKTDHMVSLLHGVWWHRVVADGAQILATHQSARTVAASGLAGRARWCVVEREGMAIVESSSERMRSLATFLRVPDGDSLVEAAECLFYHSRPSDVAPHPCRDSAADTSLVTDDSPGVRSRRASTRTRRRVGNSVELARGAGANMNDRGEGQARHGRRLPRRAAASGATVQPLHGGDEVGGVRTGLSRDDVTYTATTLRFRSAHGVETAGVGRCRGERL